MPGSFPADPGIVVGKMGLSVLLLLNSDFLLGRHEGENRVD